MSIRKGRSPEQQTAPPVGGQRPSILEEAVLSHAHENPEDGQAKAAAALTDRGLPISAAGVRYIWRKHDLETAYKRLRALKNGVLTPAQAEILRRGDSARRIARLSQQPEDSKALPDDRRAHVLLAAAELLVKNGYGRTSMRDIAARVGLLPGSVYHYFPSKNELIVALNREGFRQLISRATEAERTAETPRGKLEAVCGVHVEALVGGNPVQRITATTLFAIHEKALQRRMRGDRDAYESIFSNLVDGLDLPPQIDRSVFRMSLLGALNWTHVWYRPGRLTPNDIARQIVAALLR
jgi:AcrR family transcriptional regulator